ncbi:ComF family protein [Thalassospira sp. MA62]|nr:ComF family protein [Thalassospira sp. MA62]
MLRRIVSLGLDAILPPRCGGCGDVTDTPHAVCAACWSEIRFIAPPICACCGYPFELDAVDDGSVGEKHVLCGPCHQKKPTFDRARSALVYDDASRDYLLRFKHADRTDLTPLLVRWLLIAGQEIWKDADLIVPVPLHRHRLRFRRYNQSGLLAAGLSAKTGVRWNGLLIRRIRNTRTLGGLGPSSRKREVSGAFEINPGQAGRLGLDGARVVLIDDVLTTGATVNACARILKQNGAKHVDVITIARVVR